jgi:hypothetical protein
MSAKGWTKRDNGDDVVVGDMVLLVSYQVKAKGELALGRRYLSRQGVMVHLFPRPHHNSRQATTTCHDRKFMRVNVKEQQRVGVEQVPRFVVQNYLLTCTVQWHSMFILS